MVEELNCTQFGVPFPPPGTDEAGNSTVPWIITGVVTAYRPVHRYILTTIVTFGMFANTIVFSVLVHKEMRSSGVNVIMMLIAVCDFFCSTAAVVQAFSKITEGYSSYFFAYAAMITDYLTIAFHASSLYLAVGMAFCRVRSLDLANRNRSEKDGIYMNISDFSITNHCFFLKFCMIIVGVFFKGLPCFMMLILSITLLERMKQGKNDSNNVTSSQKDRNDKIERSSSFIQIVLIVFLITEFPQAVFNFVGASFIIDYLNYFQHLTIILNLFAFFNAATSFIIYSTLSSQFRTLFMRIFFPKCVTERLFRNKNIITVQTSQMPSLVL